MRFSVTNLSFSYRGHRVFRDVTFALPAGRVCGILGVNGAGKSTLLKCLNRVLEPLNGCVCLNGKNLLEMPRPQISRHVAYVPQTSGNSPLNVFDAVLLGRKPYIKWAPTRHDLGIVEGLLQAMHLDHLALRPAHSLSGGEWQKVTVARALAQEPDLLLMDEPTSSLDLKNQLEVMDLIAGEVARGKLSAVVSMHDLNLAFRYADYFLMLKDGGVHAFCPREEATPEMVGEVYGVDVSLEKVRGHTVAVPVKKRPPAVSRSRFRLVCDGSA